MFFNGTASGTWHVGQHVLPQSASFKYLSLVFHESGSMLPAVAKLAQNGKISTAHLSAKHKAFMCSKSFPVMRRLIDAVVRSAVSYRCEVWAAARFLALSLELKDMRMLGLQMTFFCQLCQLARSVTPDIIFREFSERPWLDTWWSFLLGFMQRLSYGPCCLMTACILTFSGITLLMRRAHCRVPTGLEALKSSLLL